MKRALLRSGSSWLAIVATQGVICGAGSAAAITITETINLNQALNNGGPNYSGVFDINSLLPNTGQYDDPLHIVSATVAAYGYSTTASQQVVGGYSAYQQTYAGDYAYTAYAQGYAYAPATGYGTYYYSCGWLGHSTCSEGYYFTYYYPYYYYYPYTAYASIYNETEYNTVTNLDNTNDTLAITAGTDTVSGSDSRTVTDYGNTTSYQYSTFYYNGYPEYNYYSSTDNVDDFISGPLSATGALSASSLDLLAQGGQLTYSVDASSGQFNLTQLTLTVTVDAPEPSSLSVFGFGLLLLALRARQWKRPENDQPGQDTLH